MVKITQTLTGTISNEAGTAQTSKTVFIFNKTKDEQHSGREGGDYANLVTNGSGVYTVDLTKFTGGVSNADEVFVSVCDPTTNKKGIGRVIIDTGTSSQTKNLTIKTIDPHYAITWLLRSRITDPNTSRANVLTMIMPNKQRSMQLNKNSYPRMSITQTGEESKYAGINNSATVDTIKLRVKVHIWAKDGDMQELTMDDSVDREGQVMRDYLLRKADTIIRQRFQPTDPSTRDPMVQDFFGLKKTGKPEPELDEKRGTMDAWFDYQFNAYTT